MKDSLEIQSKKEGDKKMKILFFLIIILFVTSCTVNQQRSATELTRGFLAIPTLGLSEEVIKHAEQQQWKKKQEAQAELRRQQEEKRAELQRQEAEAARKRESERLKEIYSVAFFNKLTCRYVRRSHYFEV